jgi:hypothetical protein
MQAAAPAHVGHPVVWIDDRGEPVDLECIAVAEADRRVAMGQFPAGVMLGRALYRREIGRPAPAAWVRRAHRVVVCDTADRTWLEALGPGGPQVRFLPAPFGPRSFAYLLNWLADAS